VEYEEAVFSVPLMAIAISPDVIFDIETEDDDRTPPLPVPSAVGVLELTPVKRKATVFVP
jgi:hypothetical protein